LGFLFVRLVDATIVWRTLPMAWLTRSTGRWTSPIRRPVHEPGEPEVGIASGSDASRHGGELGLTTTRASTLGVEPARDATSSPRIVVLRDTLLVGVVLAMVVGLVHLGLPALVAIVATVVVLGLAVGWGHRGTNRVGRCR
jgi:hypothetical protein